MARPVVVSIDVQAFDVTRMVERTLNALSGVRLEAFLRGPAHEYLENEIVQRFAYEGDKKSGDWPPLSETTRELRRAMGYSEDEINIRTGEMFHVLTHEADFYPGAASADMSLPGSAGSRGQMGKKMETATHGRAAGSNVMYPGSETPARPVLAVDETDLATILELLNLWVIAEIAGSF